LFQLKVKEWTELTIKEQKICYFCSKKTGIVNDVLERFKCGVGITPARTDQQGKPPSQRKYKMLPPEYRLGIFNNLLGFCTLFVILAVYYPQCRL
jgi:hypothetical protein